MTVQTAYSRFAPQAYAGLLAGVKHYVSTYKNPGSRDVQTIAITAQNTTAYTVTVRGVTISYTSDGSATQAEINAGLEAAALASPFFNALATLVEGSSAAQLVLSARDPSVDLQAAVSSDLALTVVSAPGKELPFGRFVAVGAQSTEPAGGVYCKELESGAVIAGVTVHTHAVDMKDYERPLSTATTGGFDSSGYMPGDTVNVARQGLIWVEAEEALTPGAPVYARFTSGSNAVIGRIRTDADSASAALVPGARVSEYNSTLGLALVEVNMP